MKREHAYKLRDLLHKAAVSLSDEDALDGIELFPVWMPDTHYAKEGEQAIRVRDPENNLLYKLIPKTHDSQSDWPPHLVPAIWTRVDDPAEEWPEWHQPDGAHDAYTADAKVSHNGKRWINTYGDGNIWEPGVYGWEVVA